MTHNASNERANNVRLTLSIPSYALRGCWCNTPTRILHYTHGFGAVMTKKQLKDLDRQIELIFYKNHSCVQIPMMAIPSIFQAGRDAASQSKDIAEAVAAQVESVRVKS